MLRCLLTHCAINCTTLHYTNICTNNYRAMTSTLFLNWVLGLLAPLAIFFMLFFDSTRTAAKALKWILRCVSPGFCLGDGLLNLVTAHLADTLVHVASILNGTTCGDDVVRKHH
eukprot:8774-Heterococcus_DN1.PRE.1